jgi:hypothetical protein
MVFDRDVLAFYVARFPKALTKRRQVARGGIGPPPLMKATTGICACCARAPSGIAAAAHERRTASIITRPTAGGQLESIAGTAMASSYTDTVSRWPGRPAGTAPSVVGSAPPRK